MAGSEVRLPLEKIFSYVPPTIDICIYILFNRMIYVNRRYFRKIIGGFRINKIDLFQYFVEKLGVLFFVHNTVHIFWTKHSLIFLRQPEFFFRHLIFS